MYATVDDLSMFTGTAKDDLPEDSTRLLQRAVEVIETYTMGRIDKVNAKHAEAAKTAVCAQVEYWIEVDESTDKTGAPDSYSAGSFSMSGKLPELAPRAKRPLLLAGLLYRGVNAK